MEDVRASLKLLSQSLSCQKKVKQLPSKGVFWSEILLGYHHKRDKIFRLVSYAMQSFLSWIANPRFSVYGHSLLADHKQRILDYKSKTLLA